LQSYTPIGFLKPSSITVSSLQANGAWVNPFAIRFSSFTDMDSGRPFIHEFLENKPVPVFTLTTGDISWFFSASFFGGLKILSKSAGHCQLIFFSTGKRL